MTAIVGLCRSPFCTTFGHLSQLNSQELVAKVVDSVIKRAHVDPKLIKTMYIGQVLPQSQNINKIYNILSPLDLNNICITSVNSLCNSGLTSLILSHNTLLQKGGISIAGGVDSISNSPYLLKNNALNTNLKYNNLLLLNSVATDYFNELSQINDDIMKTFNISNKEIEELRIASWKKTLDCLSANILEQEITPFKVKTNPVKHPNKLWITAPELRIHKDQALDEIPEFHKCKDMQAPLVDGACMLVLGSEDYVKKYKLGEITRIIGTSEVKTSDLESSIKESLSEVLNEAKIVQSAIDVYEISDHHIYLPPLVCKILKLDTSRVNLHGCSTAIGFCPGASGTRMIISLISVLKSRGLRYGCAIGINILGQVSTILLENKIC